MIIIAAVDDRYGMMFNKRRVSQDSAVREHLIKLCDGSKLWMNLYSLKQFNYINAEHFALEVAEDFLERAGNGAFCFVENCSVLPYVDKIEKVILYKWNRNYPADVFFDLPLSENSWKCNVIEEFVGTSHEKITVEEWKR